MIEEKEQKAWVMQADTGYLGASGIDLQTQEPKTETVSEETPPPNTELNRE